jgi:hypothetical protein
MFERHVRFEPWQVRCYGDDLALHEWRAAVRRAGYRLRDGEDGEGHPVLIVFLRDRTDALTFGRTMQMGGISGSLEPLVSRADVLLSGSSGP